MGRGEAGCLWSAAADANRGANRLRREAGAQHEARRTSAGLQLATALVAQLATRDDATFLFAAEVSATAAPRPLGDPLPLPPGSALAADRALWLLSVEGGRAALSRFDRFADPPQRWEFPKADLPTPHLVDARLLHDSPVALIEDDSGRLWLYQERGLQPLPPDVISAALLDQGRILAVRGDGFEVLVPSGP